MRIAVGQESAAVARVNTFLPPDMRCFDMVRTTKLFNSKNFCSARRYGYLLPTTVLAPRSLRMNPTRLAAATRDCGSERITADYIRVRFLGPRGAGGAPDVAGLSAASISADPFCNGQSAAAAVAEMRNAKITASAAATSEFLRDDYVSRHGEERGSVVAAASTLDDYQTGAAFARAADEIRAHRLEAASVARCVERERCVGYALPFVLTMRPTPSPYLP
jgi:tRNA U38,U39,U40 pseudouridine synthase TruA